jgi:hypothetical protein
MENTKNKYVILDQDHRDILKCFSGKKIKYHSWCDDRHDWKEMDYFNATRITRVRIDIRQQPNWFRVAEKGLFAKTEYNSSYKVIGYVESPNGDCVYVMNPLYKSTLIMDAKDLTIDFEREGLTIQEEE